MSIDPYTPCPGGTNKKIKFCCAELVGELDKLRRMVEGEQYQAALGHIDSLSVEYPQRSCLEVIKATVHLAIGQYEEAETTLRTLLERTPDNALALSHLAIAVGHVEGPLAAVEPLQRALELSEGDKLPAELAQAIASVGTMFASVGNIPAARGHWLLRSRIKPADETVTRLLTDLRRNSRLPLPLREDITFGAPPADADWAEAYNAATSTAQRGLWKKACDEFAAITSTAQGAPQVWRALATLRGWLGDTAGCVAVLRRLASLDVPTDDAVEAEMLAQLLDPDPPVDEIEQLTVSLTVRDVDTVIERLTDDRRTLLVNVDPRSFRHDDDEPPPRSVYTLLDRAMPASDTNLAEISGDDLAAVLGLVTVHGRQTDREPRVELRTYRDATLEVANGIVREILGDQVDGEPTETADGGVPAETVILGCNWHFPEGTPIDRRIELQTQFRQQAFLTKWPEHPLALLGGKTPREAAADPALKIRLLAHLNLLELGEQRSDSNVDIDVVREELGLAKPDSIDPGVQDPRSVPLVRLARLEMDKLAPEQTVTVFYRLLATNAHAGLRKLVPVMIERGDFDATQETAVKTLTLSEAYCLMADLAGRSPLAIAYLEKARQAADDAGESNAVVDIQELSIRIEREETAEFSRLVEHVLSAHGNEPGVRETVFSLLAQLGLITPDGRPMAPSVGATAPAATAGGGGSSEIWTPESEQSGGGKSLWLPGSD